jgi:hypothetical protein
MKDKGMARMDKGKSYLWKIYHFSQPDLYDLSVSGIQHYIP